MHVHPVHKLPRNVPRDPTAMKVCMLSTSAGFGVDDLVGTISHLAIALKMLKQAYNCAPTVL